MPNRDILSGKGFATPASSGPGWILRKGCHNFVVEPAFLELKEKKKAKCNLDGVTGS
jgi:hypothetical protein